MKQPLELVAKVVIPGVPLPLYYSIDKTTQLVEVGAQVDVELNRRQASGWVVAKEPLGSAEKEITSRIAQKQSKSSSAAPSQLSLLTPLTDSAGVPRAIKLKPVLAAHPAFSQEQVSLFEWIADYYGVSVAEVMDGALPRRSPSRPIYSVRICEDAQAKYLDDEELEKLRKKAPIQAAIIETLLEAGKALPLTGFKQLGNSATQSIQALKKKSLVSIIELEDSGWNPLQPGVFSSPAPDKLTQSQEQALRQITSACDTGQFSPLLLHGVTGSGKTEVYLRAIQAVIGSGGGAVVIVPEIALTPQLIERFEHRLETTVSVLHSQVSSQKRWRAWEDLLQGNSLVAVGARSAVFAPVKNLKLVIVDEEHESSYKQSDNLRYHARDVAVMRAKFAACPVILGSATPSFESLLNVKHGRYKLLEMPERVTSRTVPEIEIVDLRKVRKKDMSSTNISPKLYQAMTETITGGGQIVILYNRRGFSWYLQCESCGEAIECPNCSVALTFHKRRGRLLCHYCNYSIIAPELCSFCRNPKTTQTNQDETSLGKLLHVGSGTERVVEEVAELFPNARVLRMDRDTMSKQNAYREVLTKMRRGEADILIGTQMIAKGHDLPGVTLVGIIDADVGLHLPDFRANEKTFQLITQAAGRAGRGDVSGRVLVQTREPHNSTIVALKGARFKAFARFELERRRSLGYPPWNGLMRIVLSSPDSENVYSAAFSITEWLNQQNEYACTNSQPFMILGPAPAPYARLRGRFRWHLLVKSASKKQLSLLAHRVNAWKGRYRGDEDIRITADVDPVDML